MARKLNKHSLAISIDYAIKTQFCHKKLGRNCPSKYINFQSKEMTRLEHSNETGASVSFGGRIVRMRTHSLMLGANHVFPPHYIVHYHNLAFSPCENVFLYPIASY